MIHRSLASILIGMTVTGCAQMPESFDEAVHNFNNLFPEQQNSSGYLAGTGTGSRNPEQLTPDIYPDGAKPSPEPVVRYGRYSLVSVKPSAEQQDLMSQIIDVTIPANMTPSVKDAMDHVMRRTGYTLCPAPTPEVETLYSRPLPAAHYHLGPMTLRNVLQVLAGPAFTVKVDEVARDVCFFTRPEYRPTTTKSRGAA